MTNGFTFIDLFAGIGGFHLAAKKLGGVCVFASEIDKKAREVYIKNFYNPNNRLIDKYFNNDITKIKEIDLPSFDFLFAGFPCQSFSQGGKRKGFADIRGTLFFDIIRIIKMRKPKYFLLENVSNLVKHDGERTFKKITNELKKQGYVLNSSPLVLSPDQFGIPVIRKRIYIPGIRKDLLKKKSFELNFSKDFKKSKNIYSIVDKVRKPKRYYISEYELNVLNMWNEFYKNIDLRIIGFPIWFEELNKTYCMDDKPMWKQRILIKNRNLYKRNKNFIDYWTKKYDNLNWVKKSHKKMEWQAGDSITNIYEGIIQFRPSGVRIKRPDKFSTLVAINQSQIIGKYKRRITPNETKKLQSFPDSFILHNNDNVALKHLGNSINIEVARKIIKKIGGVNT